MYDHAVTELLREREAKGLQVPAYARIVFALFGGLSALDGVPSTNALAMIWAIILTTIVTNGVFVWALVRRRHVTLIGWLGIAIDVISMVAYVRIGHAILEASDLHWAYSLKGLMSVVYITFIAINGMALRPIYPVVVGTAASIVFTIQVIFALGDPSIVWAEAPSFVGPQISSSAASSQISFLVLITGIMFFLTRAARSAVVEAALRQAERDRFVREQQNSVMEGRLDALRNLVASLSHEMNTPLGAIKSAVETMGVAAERVVAQVPDLASTDPKAAKMLRLIADTAKVPVGACDRLDGIVRRLSVFAALDGHEGESVDVNDAVERTIALVPPQARSTTEIVCEYTARSPVQVSGPRLNLALLTIVTNAFEAVKGQGVVRVRTEEDDANVRVVVADNGPGLSLDLLPRIFEFRFDRSDQRVKVGLGLPAAYSLMKKHGGDIGVTSVAGEGATFIITLPKA